MDLQVRTTMFDVSCRELTVTAAEDTVEATTIDNRLYAVCRSRVTTAKDIFDGVIATIYMNCGPLGRCRTTSLIKYGTIIGISATAEDVAYSIGWGTGSSITYCILCSVCSLVDIHSDVTLRRAVGIVTTIDTTVNGGIARS